MRAVLDTNTIISGLFWKGLPRDVLHAATMGVYSLLMSPDLIAELTEVLGRSKFDKLRDELGKSADTLVSELQDIAQLVTPVAIPLDAVRDPKDRMVLACALGGNADCIVSGDKDLLVLKRYLTVPIVSAAQFLNLFDT